MFKPETNGLAHQKAPDFGHLLDGAATRDKQHGSSIFSMLPEMPRPLKEGVQAAAYSAVAEPIIGVSQVVEAVPGCQFLKKTPEMLATIGFRAPAAPTSALEADAQRWGSTVGSMVPFILMHKFVRAGAAKFVGESATAQVADLALASRTNFAGTLAREGALSFTTGLICGSAFKVSDPTLSGREFAKARVWEGVTNGATMAALTATSFGLGRVAQSGVVRSDLVRTALTHPVMGGALSAVPAGLVQSEMTALRNGQYRPTLGDVGDNIYQMAKTGVVLGAVHGLGLRGRGLAPDGTAERVPGKTLVGADAQSETNGPILGPALSKSEAMRDNPVMDLESPLERATRLNLSKDMVASKAILFGKVDQGDGMQTDVVIRPYASGAKSDMRVFRAGVSGRVGDVLSGYTGVRSSALPAVLRDNFTFPDMKLEKFDWTKTTTEPAIVQENGGKPIGQQFKDWTMKAYGDDGQGEPVLGTYSRLLNENPEVRSLMGRAAFDNMFKGNIDLVEFSQQTVYEAKNHATLEPSRHHTIVAIDNKNDFTNLEAPSWGFGSQFGMPMEVAKTFEGKPLAWADPALQADAEKLLRFFTSESGKVHLVEAGLTPLEVEAAGKRLALLTAEGFPKHLGETNFYADEAQTQLSASLTDKYEAETAKAQKYLADRDRNLTLKTIDGKLVVVRDDGQVSPCETDKK